MLDWIESLYLIGDMSNITKIFSHKLHFFYTQQAQGILLIYNNVTLLCIEFFGGILLAVFNYNKI